MAPVVELRDAIVLLGRFPALTGVELTIEAGELVLLEGSNGAGKTTLLRTLAGLHPLESGSARVLGVDLVTDRRSVRRGVGLLGHHSGLYDDLTVAENMAFWCRAAGVGVDAGRRALIRVGLEDRLREVPVVRLSAGQRRRVALALVVARRPHLWLLDEPHAGLDADGRDLLDGLLVEATAAGATVVFASHELERSRSLGPRSCRIEGGRVVATAPGAAVSEGTPLPGTSAGGPSDVE